MQRQYDLEQQQRVPKSEPREAVASNVVAPLARPFQQVLVDAASVLGKGIILIAILALVAVLLWKGCIVGRFYWRLKRQINTQNYTAALNTYSDLQGLPFQQHMFVENRVFILAMLQDWKGVLNTTTSAIGFYKYDYMLWYYKGLAELMLGMDEESQKSMHESKYFQETDASKYILQILQARSRGQNNPITNGQVRDFLL